METGKYFSILLVHAPTLRAVEHNGDDIDEVYWVVALLMQT